MKIIGIDREHSSAEWAAFRPDGELGDELITRFKRLFSERRETRSVKMEVRDSLVCVAVVDAPRGIAALISQLLTEAEAEIERDRDIEHRSNTLEAEQKEETLNRIASEEGLPIL